MTCSRCHWFIITISAAAWLCDPALAQQAAPPPGYFDIPAGFDFPANKQTLEQYRASGNLSAQRLHVWNVFAGMTQRTPDGKFAIFETWFSEDEAFQVGPQPQASGPRRVVRRFDQPNQLKGPPGGAVLQAAGTALLSEVLFNFPNYNHIRTQKLYLADALEQLRQTTGAPDPKVPNNRVIPSFPAESVSLKTVWWPVAKTGFTPMPVWDPELNPARSLGNPFTTWARVVAIDPSRPTIPAGEKRAIGFAGTNHPDANVVSIQSFHFVELDEQTAARAMDNGRTRAAVRLVFGPDRPLQAGDYVVFAGTHLTTKEIDDWVWATFWWHDRPNDGLFAADRSDLVKGVWRNYLMSASYDLNLPRESDGMPHIAFNPWLEAGFPDGGAGTGIVSNCMNCHNRAAWQPNWPGQAGRVFLPIFRGEPNIANDPAYANGRLRTDFLWSVPFSAN
jgi:hypothetical protein